MAIQYYVEILLYYGLSFRLHGASHARLVSQTGFEYARHAPMKFQHFPTWLLVIIIIYRLCIAVNYTKLTLKAVASYRRTLQTG